VAWHTAAPESKLAEQFAYADAPMRPTNFPSRAFVTTGESNSENKYIPIGATTQTPPEKYVPDMQDAADVAEGWLDG
jgi:hypothetical protein